MPPSLTTDQVKQRVQELENGEYELVGTYLGSSKPISLLHRLCGGTSDVTAKGFLQEGAGRCRACNPITARRGPTMTEEVFRQRVAEQLDESYRIDEFKGYKKPISVTHTECGTTWETTPHMLIGVKQRRCPTCANLSRGSHLRSPTYLADVLTTQEWGSDYEWLEEYTGDNKVKLRLLHRTCGREYPVRPNDFQQGYRCPLCCADSNESYGSKLIDEELTRYGIEFKRETTYLGLKYFGPLRFDFDIEIQEGRRLVIEYDGQQHFKATWGEAELRRTQARDAAKNRFCEARPDKFVLHRIDYTQDVKAELRRILELYFDF